MLKNYTGKFRKSILATGIAVLGSAGLNAQVTTFPWMETFEDASPTRAAWTQIHEVNQMSWTFATQASTGGWGVAAYEGVKMANFPGTSHNFDKTKLVSPVLDLSNASSATLSFHYRNPFWSPDQNWLRIFYRTSPESAWVQISEFHSDVTVWTSSGSINLPTPTGTYQIAVECETDYGYSTTVDALIVEKTVLSVGENNMLTMRYFPNPASDKLFFSANGEIEDITIYNYLGQVVSQHKIGIDHGSIDVSSLASGHYIVKARNHKGTHTFKMVRQ